MNKQNSRSSSSWIRSIIGTPTDFRENIKVIVAASLAAGCWISYGVLIHTQFSVNREAATKITAFADTQKILTPEDEKRIAIIKDANSVVNQTASTIYALITPVATAITGYFFVSSGFRKNSDSTDEDQVNNSTKKEPSVAEASSSNVSDSSTEGTPI
jgi:hypothetical protein